MGKVNIFIHMVIMAGSSAWSVMVGGVTAEHDFTLFACRASEENRFSGWIEFESRCCSWYSE